MTIKELREREKLSQTALAKALGVTAGAIGHLENGRIRLSTKMISIAKRVYGVELTEPDAAPAPEQAPEKKPAKKKTVAKPKAAEFIIQSPMGGEITPDQVRAKIPAGTDRVYIRIDQNKLWWIRGEEYGSTDIWE